MCCAPRTKHQAGFDMTVCGMFMRVNVYDTGVHFACVSKNPGLTSVKQG